MKKKVYRQRYAIPKQDEIYTKEELVKEITKKSKKVLESKKKSDK